MPKRRIPELTYGFACDDIRPEIGNKRSFVGVYTGNIIVPALPHTFPKLCFHLVFRGLKSGDSINCRLLDSRGTEILKLAQANIQLPEKSEEVRCILEMGITGLQIKNDGMHRLEFLLGDAKEPFDKFDFEIRGSK